jgi:arylsulfatase A-like enzyme
MFMNKRNIAATVKGTPVEPKNPPGNTNPLRFHPNLEGEYVVDFFYFLKSKENEPVLAAVKHIDKEGKEIQEIKLNGKKATEDTEDTGEIHRCQEILDLEKDDTIAISTKGADFGFISHLMVYKKRKTPDFVFIIVADTLRWDFLGAYNKEKKCSPHIDRFSKDAAVFTQAYSTSPWTVPAHVSMFTGLFPNNHQVNYANKKLHKDKSIPVLFEKLQDRFITYSVNDSHMVSSKFGFYRGFDIYAELKRVHRNRASSKRTFDHAIQLILEEKSKHALFFLHSYQVHNPYNPEIHLAKEYYRLIGRNDFDQFYFRPTGLIKKGRELFKKLPEKEKKDIETIYEAGVYTFDYRFGEFIDFLEEKGIYEDSMIFLLSDHGDEFMDHGAWEQGHSLYNELIKIPLLVKFPGNQYADRKIAGLVSITDVLPTIMEVANVTMDESIHQDGLSLVQVFKGNQKKKRTLIAYLAAAALRRKIPGKIAVISENLKFIHKGKPRPGAKEFFIFPPPPFKHEMFDIFSDPMDKTNLIFKKPGKKRKFETIIKALNFKKGKKNIPQELKRELETLGYL